jgi:hypothetical protein
VAVAHACPEEEAQAPLSATVPEQQSPPAIDAAYSSPGMHAHTPSAQVPDRQIQLPAQAEP